KILLGEDTTSFEEALSFLFDKKYETTIPGTFSKVTRLIVEKENNKFQFEVHYETFAGQADLPFNTASFEHRRECVNLIRDTLFGNPTFHFIVEAWYKHKRDDYISIDKTHLIIKPKGKDII